jgi:putative endonuclease
LIGMPYFVYVLANPQNEIYIGQTSDFARRLFQHNDAEYRGTLHTKRHPGPWKLVHKEQLATRRDAMRRERELKSSRGRAWIRGFMGIGC